MIQYIERTPANYQPIAEGFFRAQMAPVLAGLLLKISNGEYVVNELQRTLIVTLKNNPNLAKTFNLEDRLYYTLGTPEVGADFGTSICPFKIYAKPR